MNLIQTEKAIKELKKIYTNVPVGFPEGGMDEYSTYLHFLVKSSSDYGKIPA
jgi:hypothetical protein